MKTIFDVAEIKIEPLHNRYDQRTTGKLRAYF